MIEEKRISLSPSAFAIHVQYLPKKRVVNSSFLIDLTRPPFFYKRSYLVYENKQKLQEALINLFHCDLPQFNINIRKNCWQCWEKPLGELFSVIR